MITDKEIFQAAVQLAVAMFGSNYATREDIPFHAVTMAKEMVHRTLGNNVSPADERKARQRAQVRR